MQFNIYIIDDREDKIEALPFFIDWLRLSYPAFTFKAGFTVPTVVPSHADLVTNALEDPLGVILLDAMMQSPEHQATGRALQKIYGISDGQLAPTHEALHSHGGTRLAAVIISIAQQLGLRVVYISNQTIDPNLGQDLPLYPNIPWYIQGDRLSWCDRHKPIMDHVLSTFHEEPALSEALAFFVAPPSARQGGGFSYWDHNELQPMHGGAAGRHNAAMKDWLGVSELDGESAKAMLYSGALEWAIRETSSGRPIVGSIIAATCKKVGVELCVDFAQSYRLPCEPGLPFLIALGNVIWQMRKCDKTHPPEKISLLRSNGEHCVRLDLAGTKRDGSSVDMNAFETSFSNGAGHETCSRLHELEMVKVFQHNPVGGRPSVCFLGTTEKAVRIEFDKSIQTPGVLIIWTTDNL